MKLDEAKAQAKQVDEAARALNKSISDAARLGLVIEASFLEVGQLGQGSVPFVQVSAKVRPADIHSDA